MGTLQQRSTNADRSKAGLLLGCCLPSNKSDHQVGLLLNRNMVGFCWPVRCCCWLALWLSFGLGNFSGTISAFYFINNKRMLIRCYLLLTCKRRVIVFFLRGWMEMSLSEEKKQRFWELLASHPKNEQQKSARVKSFEE